MFKNLSKLRDDITARRHYLSYGRHVIVDWVKDLVEQKSAQKEVRILDIGAGAGTDLLNIKQALIGREIKLFGVDAYSPHMESLRSKGITPVSLNIEKDALPFSDGFFDICVANQILEHVKELFWIVSEISRILKKKWMLHRWSSKFSSCSNAYFDVVWVTSGRN